LPALRPSLCLNPVKASSQHQELLISEILLGEELDLAVRD